MFCHRVEDLFNKWDLNHDKTIDLTEITHALEAKIASKPQMAEAEKQTRMVRSDWFQAPLEIA